MNCRPLPPLKQWLVTDTVGDGETRGTGAVGGSLFQNDNGFSKYNDILAQHAT